MSNYDWSRFSKRINVNASYEDLYNAWATRSGLEKWFLRLAEFRKPDGSLRDSDEPVQAGDTYKWLWHGWSDMDEEQGKILEANGKDVFKFTFGGPPDSTMMVTVTITTEEGEPVVQLHQENISQDEQGRTKYHIGCMEGWTFHLVNLKSILEGGIDLRNRNEKMKVLNK